MTHISTVLGQASESSSKTRRVAGSLALRAERAPGLPLVSVRMWLRGGARHEPTPGLGCVSGRLLGEGTSSRDYRRLADDIERRGMWLHAFGGGETLGIAIDALAFDVDVAIATLAELALDSSFSSERTTWIATQAAAELDGVLDQPESRAGLAFLKTLYGEHPYGRPLQGSRSNLEALVSQECQHYHQQCVDWGGCVAVVGDIDAQRVIEQLELAFGASISASIVKGDSPTDLPPVRPISIGPGTRLEVEAGEADQAHVFLGHVTVPRNHPDRPALELVGIALGAGGGMSGRLPDRVRESEGLAYHVDVSIAAGAGFDAGRLMTYVGTSPGQVEQAERAVREELERLVTDGLTAEELDESRAYVLGREPFRRETLRQRSDLIAEAELYGLPVDQPDYWRGCLEGLTLADVNAAARRWIKPECLHAVIGLPGGETSDEESSDDKLSG